MDGIQRLRGLGRKICRFLACYSGSSCFEIIHLCKNKRKPYYEKQIVS